MELHQRPKSLSFTLIAPISPLVSCCLFFVLHFTDMNTATAKLNKKYLKNIGLKLFYIASLLLKKNVTHSPVIFLNINSYAAQLPMSFCTENKSFAYLLSLRFHSWHCDFQSLHLSKFIEFDLVVHSMFVHSIISELLVIIINHDSTRNTLIMIVLTKWVETLNTHPYNYTKNN